MVIRVLCIVLIVAYVGFNLVAAKKYNMREMWNAYIADQCVVGMICANIFYAPAWLLKFLRRFINIIVK